MEFDKKCRVSLSPNTVLPPIPPSPKVEKRSSKGRPRRRDELLIIEDNNFTEIRFSRFRSASCKNESLRPFERAVELRRGSVYKTSGEVKKLGTEDVRSKIEISRSRDKYFSVRNVDSVCGSSRNGEPCTSSDEFVRNKLVTSSVVKLSMQGEPVAVGDGRCKLERVAVPPFDAKGVRRELQKSVSAKVEMQQSPCRSSNESLRASPKPRFSPLRKIMDPFIKSKSLNSPLGYDITRESLLPAPHSLDSDSHSAEIDCCHLAKACSPTHLHGCLKLKKINSLPVFEFSLKSPEDIYVARKWRTKGAYSWVYTFHTDYNRKHSNASARGSSKICDNSDAAIVGQMQASSYLQPGHGEIDVRDSQTTEFVLYDIAHANRCIPPSDTSGLPKGSIDDNVVFQEKLTPTLKDASEINLRDSTSYPWAPAQLHPNLEVAAIVIEVPSEKRESLKRGKAEKIDEARYIEVKRGSHRTVSTYPKINVVASMGNHSLPEAEFHGPSPLLTRWRSGGGCECGGWDMTCPLTVLNNGAERRKGSHLPVVAENIPMELFVQGLKEEDMPAFSMTKVEEGHYSVNFCARLSVLQAFSISIATLHSSETSPMIIPPPQSNTLKTFLEDEVKFLVESVADISMKKTASLPLPPTKDQKAKETSPFTFTPPFSPISRA